MRQNTRKHELDLLDYRHFWLVLLSSVLVFSRANGVHFVGTLFCTPIFVVLWRVIWLHGLFIDLVEVLKDFQR